MFISIWSILACVGLSLGTVKGSDEDEDVVMMEAGPDPLTLRKLLQEIDESPEKFLEQKALFEEEISTTALDHSYILDVIKILKRTKLPHELWVAGVTEKYQSTIYYLEKLRTTVALVADIKCILHDQRTLATAKAFLDDFLNHPSDEPVIKKFMFSVLIDRESEDANPQGQGISAPEDVDAVHAAVDRLLMPKVPFPAEIMSQLTSENPSFPDLRKAIQTSLDLLFNVETFPAGPLLQAMYFLKPALSKGRNTNAPTVLDLIEEYRSKGETIISDLQIKRKLIEQGYRRDASGKQLMGMDRLQGLESQVSRAVGDCRAFLAVMQETPCAGRQDDPSAPQRKAEWDRCIVRRLMKEIETSCMACLIVKSVSLDSPGLGAGNSGKSMTPALDWVSELKDIFKQAELQHGEIMEEFKRGAFEPRMRMMMVSKDEEVDKQKGKLDEIVNEACARVKGMLVTLGRLLAEITEKRADGEQSSHLWTSAGKNLCGTGKYLAMYAKSLTGAKKEITTEFTRIIRAEENGGARKRKKRLVGSRIDGSEFRRSGLRKEMAGLHLIFLDACNPDAEEAECLVGPARDLAMLGQTTRECMQQFEQDMRRVCAPIIICLSKMDVLPGSLLILKRTSGNWSRWS